MFRQHKYIPSGWICEICLFIVYESKPTTRKNGVKFHHPILSLDFSYRVRMFFCISFELIMNAMEYTCTLYLTISVFTAARRRVISSSTHLQWPVQRIPGHHHPREEDVHRLPQSHPDWWLHRYKYGAHSKTTPRQVCSIWLVGCSGLYRLACERYKLDKLTIWSHPHFYAPLRRLEGILLCYCPSICLSVGLRSVSVHFLPRGCMYWNEIWHTDLS